MALTKYSSRALQRQIDLTTAVCQERLLTTHVRHALGLVDLISDRIPFDDALDIYVRVLRLTPEQARNVGSRALAELGRRTRNAQNSDLRFDPDLLDDDLEDDDEADEEEGRSGALLSRLRKRIRGRVRDDLRNLIDLATARTEDALLETHADNALMFVRALSEEVPAPEAVDLYLDTMGIPERIGDVIYNRALRRIADSVLPALPMSSEGSSTPIQPTSESQPANARREG